MKWLVRKLLSWRAAARRWHRREVLRAVFSSTLAHLRSLTSLGSRPVHRRIQATSSLQGTIESVVKDVWLGFRALRKRPLFTTVAVGTVGIGIGASTVVFSLVDGVLLQELPYKRPAELVNIWQVFPEWRGHEVLSEIWDRCGFDWPEYVTLRENSQTLEAVAVHKRRQMVLSSPGTAERVTAGEGSPSLFPMLGIRALHGRLFLPGEEGVGTARLAVLSYPLWVSRFGSDLNIVGSTVELDQEPFEVIGVLPPGTRVPSVSPSEDRSTLDSGNRALWIPVNLDGPGLYPLEVMGRLAPGVESEQARAEIDALLRDGRTAEELRFRLANPREEIVSGHRSSLHLLLAAAAILLVVACANVAALLLSEVEGRRREMATRLALGAGRVRIARYLLTESAILGFFGGGLGLLFAVAGIPSFLSLAPPLPRIEEVGMHFEVFLFSALGGVGTGVVFGLAPVLLVQDGSLHLTSSTGRRGSGVGWGLLQRVLLAGEMALTVVLLFTGGLLAVSFLNLGRVDPGFNAESVATIRVHLPAAEHEDTEGVHTLLGKVLVSARAIPGVVQVGGVDGLPFPGSVRGARIEIPQRANGGREFALTRSRLVFPDYFETMEIPLLTGRTLTELDANVGSLPVILINETMARRYWLDESPLGAQLGIDGLAYEVVGIVGDVLERHLSEAPEATVYRAKGVKPQTISIVARTETAAEGLVSEIRRVVRAANPNLALSQGSSLKALVNDSTGSERYRTMLMLVFGVSATLLGSVGVFGVTSHSVSKRTRELGIRMALGAQNRRLVRGVVFESMLPGLVGMGAGGIGAFVCSRLLAGYVFGVEAWSTPILAGVMVLLGLIGLGAALFPASRVASVDPMRVLREE
jgi:putative ABC transport system permease protein